MTTTTMTPNEIRSEKDRIVRNLGLAARDASAGNYDAALQYLTLAQTALQTLIADRDDAHDALIAALPPSRSRGR